MLIKIIKPKSTAVINPTSSTYTWYRFSSFAHCKKPPFSLHIFYYDSYSLLTTDLWQLSKSLRPVRSLTVVVILPLRFVFVQISIFFSVFFYVFFDLFEDSVFFLFLFLYSDFVKSVVVTIVFLCFILIFKRRLFRSD